MGSVGPAVVLAVGAAAAASSRPAAQQAGVVQGRVEIGVRKR